MNVSDAVRFLEHEASWCRSRDQHEALCLLLPPLLKVLELRPMNAYEAEAFRAELKKELAEPKEAQQLKAPQEPVFERKLAGLAVELWSRCV